MSSGESSASFFPSWYATQLTSTRAPLAPRGLRSRPALLLGEERIRLEEDQLHHAGRALALLRDVELDLLHVGLLRRLALPVVAGTVQEHDDVGVLLDRARLAQVGEHRRLALALLDAAVELREREDRDPELLRQALQRPADDRDLLLARLRRRVHELEVVDDDEVEAPLALDLAALRAELHRRQHEVVVEPDARRAHPVAERHDAVPVVLLQEPLREAPEVELRLGGEDAHRE